MLNNFFFKKNNNKPEVVFLSFPSICNLNCNHCDIGKNTREKKNSKSLDLDKTKKIIDKLHDWIGKSFSLSFLAGEPFLHKNILSVISYSSSKNITTSLTNNGTLILSDDIAENIVKSGLSYMAFSLDSFNPKIHDKTRGVDGTSKKVFAGIDKIIRAKEKLKSITPQIYVNSIIMNENLDELKLLTKWSIANKIDGITFQPIASKQFFDASGNFTDYWYKTSSLWPEKNEVLNFIDFLIEEKKSNSCIKNSLNDLLRYKDYFSNPIKYARKNKCSGLLNALSILENGDITVCVSLNPKLGNILFDDLDTIWNSKEMFIHRKKVFNCKGQCKILGCNKEDFYF